MRDWSEALLSAQTRLKAAQKALTLVNVGGGAGHDKKRADEAETLLLYAQQDITDAIAWARSI
jgi:diaminopimelate decarboxylase